MIAILREEMGKGAFPAILHCFTAASAGDDGVELAPLYVSFSGILTFKTSESCAASPGWFRATACSSRPTRPISRPVPFRRQAQRAGLCR